MPACSPAMTAMTATTLDQPSGGRFLLGLGVSGLLVAEGWHGVPYGKPLVRTRGYVSIVRHIWAREQPLGTRASTVGSPTAARARPGSASRSRASSTGGKFPSTSPPSA